MYAEVTSEYIYKDDSELANKLRLCVNDNNVDDELKKKYNKIYKRWYDMHYRAYSKKLHERAPTYIGCSVAEEWHAFENFLEWYLENYYVINGKKQKMDLDKDILVKGNKVYSPDTCCFVPHEINTMFVNCGSNRGDLPIGVSYDAERGKYRAIVGRKKLGRFKTPEKAFQCYKKEKEKQIKELARKYKGLIPDRVYEAMVHYKVEITD